MPDDNVQVIADHASALVEATQRLVDASDLSWDQAFAACQAAIRGFRLAEKPADLGVADSRALDEISRELRLARPNEDYRTKLERIQEIVWASGRRVS